VVKLFGVEFRRTSLAEIGVGRAGDRLALLRALHDHVALELCKRQQHVAQQRVDRVVGQDAEVQHVDGDALVDHLGDETGRLRHRPRQPVEPGNDEHIAAPQLRPQPVPFRSVHLGAGERVRVDFFRARRRQRRLLRVQTVAVARLRFGGYSRVAECHVNSPIFPVLTPCIMTLSFGTFIIPYDTVFCNRCQYLKVLDTKAKFHYGHNRSTTEGKQLYGGFSQYMYIEPGARLYKIPDGLPNDMACFTEVMCVAYTPEKAREFSIFDLEGVNFGDTVVVQGCGAEIVVECVGRPEVFPEGLKYLRKAGMYPEQAEDAVKASMTRESMKVVIDPWME
jgi:hypothetical protein